MALEIDYNPPSAIGFVLQVRQGTPSGVLSKARRKAALAAEGLILRA